MPTSYPSYLQTLPPDETSALAASLEKIKEHLTGELEWMRHQAQQKTIQLQGIETLLVEVAAPATDSPSSGAVESAQDLFYDQLSAELETVSEETSPEVVADNIAAAVAEIATESLSNLAHATDAVKEEETDQSNDVDSSAVTPTPAAVAEAADATPAPSKRGKQRKQNDTSQAKGGSKSTAKKTRPTTTKASNSTRSSSKSAGSRDFRRFLHGQFQDQSLTDSVGKILNRAKGPIGAKDVMEKLYEGLSGEDYNRAKNSITNVLTVGRNQGKWKSTGRGLYQSLSS